MGVVRFAGQETQRWDGINSHIYLVIIFHSTCCEFPFFYFCELNTSPHPFFLIGFKLHFLLNDLKEALKGGQEDQKKEKKDRKNSFAINDQSMNYFLSISNKTHKVI